MKRYIFPVALMVGIALGGFLVFHNRLSSIEASGGPGITNFSITPSTGADRSASFNANSGGQVNWTFEWGDGAGDHGHGPSPESPDLSHHYSPGNYSATVCALNDSGDETCKTKQVSVGGGSNPNEPQCNDGEDNDGDGSCDYGGVCGNGGGNQLPDCNCTGPGDNSEDSGGNCNQPSWVDIDVTTNKSDGAWLITCPPSPYNGGAGAPDCPIRDEGTHQYYTNLAGPGTYKITAKPPTGYAASVNGGGEQATEEIVRNPGHIQRISWYIEFYPIGGSPTGGGGGGGGSSNGALTLTPAATVTTVGTNLQVTWANTGTSAAKDWIALVPKGQTWNGNYPWKYWSNAQIPAPTTNPPANGSISLVVPPGVAVLQFVYYRDNGFVEGARSVDINVSDANGATASIACVPPYSGTVWSHNCTVQSGDSVNLQWNAPGATSCTTSWAGIQGSSGTLPSGSVTSDSSYTVNCTWPSGTQVGSNTDTANVKVGGLNLQCAGEGTPYSNGPCIVPSTGGNASLQWVSSNASACQAFGDWKGNKGLNGTQSLVVDSTENFGLSCTTLNGPTLNDSVIITNNNGASFHLGCANNACVVLNGPGSDQCVADADCANGGNGTGNCTISGSPERLTIPPPKSSTLSWSCSNVENCRIDQNIGPVDPSASTSVSPQASTDYTITCDNTDNSGMSTATARVRVFRFEGGVLKEVLP